MIARCRHRASIRMARREGRDGRARSRRRRARRRPACHSPASSRPRPPGPEHTTGPGIRSHLETLSVAVSVPYAPCDAVPCTGAAVQSNARDLPPRTTRTRDGHPHPRGASAAGARVRSHRTTPSPPAHYFLGPIVPQGEGPLSPLLVRACPAFLSGPHLRPPAWEAESVRGPPLSLRRREGGPDKAGQGPPVVVRSGVEIELEEGRSGQDPVRLLARKAGYFSRWLRKSCTSGASREGLTSAARLAEDLRAG